MEVDSDYWHSYKVQKLPLACGDKMKFEEYVQKHYSAITAHDYLELIQHLNNMGIKKGDIGHFKAWLHSRQVSGQSEKQLNRYRIAFNCYLKFIGEPKVRSFAYGRATAKMQEKAEKIYEELQARAEALNGQ